MPRLPVIHTAWVLVMMAAMLPLASYAQEQLVPQTQHGLISNLSQLEDDKNVHQYKDMYPALSAANMVYTKCWKEFNISDSEQEYLKQKFMDVTKNYLVAYQGAYTSATGSSPPQSFMDDVAKAVTKRQQDAVNSVALDLRQKGCNDGRLRPLVKYVESLHKQDDDLKNTKPAAPAEPYH